MTLSRLIEILALLLMIGLGLVVVAQFLEARGKQRGWWDREEER